jgi:hypothetical protein
MLDTFACRAHFTHHLSRITHHASSFTFRFPIFAFGRGPALTLAERGMNTVHLLLACAERRLSNPVEAAIRDACYEHAIVACTRTARVDDFFRLGCKDGFDLIVVTPENQLPMPSQKTTSDGLVEESLNAIRTIKSQRFTPIIAVAVAPEYEGLLAEAGADSVLIRPFDSEGFKLEVRRLLGLCERIVEPAVSRRSFGETLLRSWQRLTQAKN